MIKEGITPLYHLLRLLLRIQQMQGNAKRSLGPHLCHVLSHATSHTGKELAKQKKASERNHFRLK